MGRVGVSRATTIMWVRGKMQPHRYINAKVAVVLKHLQSALDIGVLPLAAKTHEGRHAELRVAVKQSAATSSREAPGSEAS